jgi:hypothetical protein
LCFVRGRVADQVVLASYGRSSGFCVDPIEKANGSPETEGDHRLTHKYPESPPAVAQPWLAFVIRRLMCDADPPGMRDGWSRKLRWRSAAAVR